MKLIKTINIEYKKKKYTICLLKHDKNHIPILLNHNIYKIIVSLNYDFLINEKNHVYTYNGDGIIYLHELVMKYSGRKGMDRAIIHINNIHFDNRIENLQYDITDKHYKKNTRKKTRIIDLSDYGIDSDLLPTYIFYVKSDATHGDRFQIEIKTEKILWRSSSSKKLSLRYKLEESKKYLRYLRKKKGYLFDNYSMNGDLNKIGQRLLREYIKMIKAIDYTIDSEIIDSALLGINTEIYLEPELDDLTNFELYILESFDPKIGYINIREMENEYRNLFGSKVDL